MAIPVTTRSGKGSPLTQAEMDTNLTNLARSATELAEGNIEIATQDEVNTGTDLTKAIPPAYLQGGIETYIGTLSSSLTSSGFYTFPGGLIIQWGRNSVGENNTLDVALPTTYPNAALQVYASSYTSGGSPDDGVSAIILSTSQIRLSNKAGSGSQSTAWLTIGY